jgi:hypothetical protein
MKRFLLSALAAMTLGGSLMMDGCYAHEGYYTDVYGRPYRHERWHDEDVWQREDGRWYGRRGEAWVVRGDVVIR